MAGSPRSPRIAATHLRSSLDLGQLFSRQLVQQLSTESVLESSNVPDTRRVAENNWYQLITSHLVAMPHFRKQCACAQLTRHGQVTQRWHTPSRRRRYRRLACSQLI